MSEKHKFVCTNIDVCVRVKPACLHPLESSHFAFLNFDPFSGCNSEQAAAEALGYTQVSWDNLSGKEKQPSSIDKHWSELTDKEKAAAVVLGYSATSWDDESGSEPQPASADKHWAELTACGEDPTLLTCLFCFPCADLPNCTQYLVWTF